MKVASNLSDIIKEVNKLENDPGYQSDIDALVADLKNEDDCSNIATPDETILESAERFTKWAYNNGFFQTMSCVKNFGKSIPSRVKNLLIENDYRRYVRTGDQAYLEKYIGGIGVLLSGTWSDEEKAKLKKNIISRVDKSLDKVAKRRSKLRGINKENSIRQKRAKILDLRKKIMAKANVAPMIFADLANEDRASAFSNDSYYRFPSLDSLNILKKFKEANESKDNKQALGQKAYNAGRSLIMDSQINYFDKICTSSLSSLIQDGQARSEAERVFPNLEEMSQCILNRAELRENLKNNLKNFTIGSLVIGGGIAACAVTGGAACAAITAGMGLAVSAADLSANSAKTKDGIACSVSGGNIDPKCKGELLSQLREERDVIVAGMLAEVPLALVDFVPIGKIVKAAVKNVKAAKNLTVGALKRIGSRAGKVVATQVKTASKSMKGLSFGQKMARMHGLIEVLQDSAESFTNFMTRIPDGVEVPDSFLDDLAQLSETSRTRMQGEMFQAITKEQYRKVLQEVSELRDVQTRLSKELGGFRKAKLKYPCMF